MSTDGQLQRRLDFMGIDAQAKAALAAAKPAIDKALPGAMKAFYGQLSNFPETKQFFADSGQMDRASARQVSHWGGIAAGQFDERYAKGTTTIGEVHARIGLEPRWYIGGYGLILDQLVRAVIEANWPKGFGVKAADREKTAAAIGAMVKAALLDMDLSISVYLEANERERAAAQEAGSRTAAEQRMVVDGLATALERLAEGDLRTRIDAGFTGEYARLKQNFNQAMERMEDAMSAVTSNAQSIHAGAGEITQAADDLSRRTEQQAATLEQTAAALDEITATVRRTTEGAQQADTAAQEAKGDAEESGHTVRRAVAAMGQIEASSKQISQIIGVIDEIAFQTNLLALNAGVEAARAGDAGKGFAVVASEVRALAQRSAEAAKEIKALISASSKQVEDGAQLVGRTGEALERMVSRVTEISSLISEIAGSAREQAIGLAEVNTAVNQMDQVTQQNAAMVEESTAASHSLAREAATLSQSVGRFQTSSAASQVAAARPVPALKTVAGRGGSAVRKPAPSYGADEWEEF